MILEMSYWHRLLEPQTVSVTGSVFGLGAFSGLVLGNDKDVLNVPAGTTSFSFTKSLAAGERYDVTVRIHPVGLTCTVANGSGIASGSVSTGIVVNCISTSADLARPITKIQISASPVLVFDHTRDKQTANNIPDLQVAAWKSRDGMVNLTIPHFQNYRMRGLSRNFPRADARATSGEGLVSHALAAAGTSWKPRV